MALSLGRWKKFTAITGGENIYIENCGWTLANLKLHFTQKALTSIFSSPLSFSSVLSDVKSLNLLPRLPPTGGAFLIDFC